MNSERISIIVPIYNVEKYLPRCIESLINQTYKNIEIILINDGSTDNCGQICNDYRKRDNRIIAINQENAGVSHARNAGLKAASGEFVGFCDPDDWVDSKMYEEMLTAMKTNNSDISICGYEYYDENGQIDINRKYKLKSTEYVSQFEIMKRMSDQPPTIRLGVVNKLFRRSIIENQRFKEGLHSAEDVMFLTEYIQKTKDASIIHKPLYLNTVREGSATHGGLSIQSLFDSFYVHELMYKTTVELYPKLKNHSQAYFLDVCTLKYTAAKQKIDELPKEQQNEWCLVVKSMKDYIRRIAFEAINNKEIYWKTRIAYLILL